MKEVSNFPEGSLCVVHLVWAPLGLEPFRKFVAAYRQNPGGISHRLLVVYNGFAPDADLTGYREELAGVPHQELVLPRPVQDIPAYFAAAAASQEEHMCFLNSYSIVLDPQWLEKLCAGLAQPGMGAVGATGSAQSQLSCWLELPWPPAPSWWRQQIRDAHHFCARLLRSRDYPPFPNYHLRTNAFLIERQRFLATRRAIPDKGAAERYESGLRSLTAQLRGQGLTVGVVGRDGVCYVPERWAESQTFRQGIQANLLVADNRTMEYAEGSPDGQRRLAQSAWEPPLLPPL